MPAEAETYVHRIGRTGRAGREGVSVSFRGFDDADVEKDLVRKYGSDLDIIRQHPFLPDGVLIPPDPAHAQKMKEQAQARRQTRQQQAAGGQRGGRQRGR